jgi:hypothetical protein
MKRVKIKAGYMLNDECIERRKRHNDEPATDGAVEIKPAMEDSKIINKECTNEQNVKLQNKSFINQTLKRTK